MDLSPEAANLVSSIITKMKTNERQMTRLLNKKINAGTPASLTLEQQIAQQIHLAEEVNLALAPDYARFRRRGVSGLLSKELLRLSSFSFETLPDLMYSFYGAWHAEGQPTLSLRASGLEALRDRAIQTRFGLDVMGLPTIRVGLDGDGWAERGFLFGDGDLPIRAIYAMKSHIRVDGGDGVQIPLGGLSSSRGLAEYIDELRFIVPLIVEAYETRSKELQPSLAVWATDGFGRWSFEMVPLAEDQTIVGALQGTHVAPPIDAPTGEALPLTAGFIACKRLLGRLLSLEPKSARDHAGNWQRIIDNAD